MLDPALRDGGVGDAAQDVAGRGSYPGHLLAAGAGRRAGPEDLDLPAWRELLRQRVKNLYAGHARPLRHGGRTGRLPGGRHGPGRAARLWGRGGERAAGRRRERTSARPTMSSRACARTARACWSRSSTSRRGIRSLPAGQDAAARAGRLIDETLADPGIVEVGYHADLRYTVTLVERFGGRERPRSARRRAEPGTPSSWSPGPPAGSPARSWPTWPRPAAASSTCSDLAPAPAPRDPEIALFRTDKDALKRKLIDDRAGAANGPRRRRSSAALQGIERREAACGRSRRSRPPAAGRTTSAWTCATARRWTP